MLDEEERENETLRLGVNEVDLESETSLDCDFEALLVPDLLAVSISCERLTVLETDLEKVVLMDCEMDRERVMLDCTVPVRVRESFPPWRCFEPELDREYVIDGRDTVDDPVRLRVSE